LYNKITISGITAKNNIIINKTPEQGQRTEYGN